MAIGVLGFVCALVFLLVDIESAFGLSFQSIVLLLLMGVEGNFVDEIRELGKTEVDEGHFLLAAEADATH